MSLINKMLQDLDKRHAADGAGKPVTQQLRPVAARKGWSRIMWEVGAGVVIGSGWAVWVLYQISPRSVVTELAFQSLAKKPHQAAAGMQAPAAAQVQPPAGSAAAPDQTASPAAPAAAAPGVITGAAPIAPGAPVAVAARPAAAGTEPIKVDMLKLATEITTAFNEKSFGVKPKSERKVAAEPAPLPKQAGKGKPAALALAEAELELTTAASTSGAGAAAAKAAGATSIDKQMRVSTPAERGEIQFRNATALLNQGRVAEAIDGYKTTLLLDAGHGAARQALLGLLLENKRIDEAQQYLQEGLSIHPDRSSYAMLLGRIQVERGDLQGAHDLLNRHAAGAANNADYHALDAAVLQRLGRHKDAVAGYQAALKLAPRAGLWWMGLGISLQADGRGAEALDAFRRAKSAGGLSSDLLTFIDQRVKQLQ